MAAFNTAQSLARPIATGTGYARADDEAHALIRTALVGSGDIIPDHDQGTLHIRLDPLPAPRHATQRNFHKSNLLRDVRRRNPDAWNTLLNSRRTIP